MRKIFGLFMALFVAMTMTGCGYNTIQQLDEEVSSNWSEVLNQYKRRADLVPQLVKVVQGYASHEKEVFSAVSEARSKAGSINLTKEALNDPKAMENFAKAQAQMSSALSRLLAVSERYPELKANEQFRDLQSQLEGTENRITVARNRYIDAIKQYNIVIRKFPSNLTAKFFDYNVKPQFTVEDEAAVTKAPEINFDTKK
jgi:LemA protein